MIEQFLKFCAVGGSGVFVDFGITYACKEWLRLNKYVANSLGFLCAATTNYILNRIWTFHNENPDIAGEMISEFGTESIVCGLDVKDGRVAVRGWKETSALTPLELGGKLCSAGAKYFLFTDISRDGMLGGANVLATAELQDKLGAYVIASGGVKDMSDIIALKDRNLYGAIIGKAYYEKKIDIEEAIEYVRS